MNRFEDLKVWQLSIELAKKVYKVVSNLPKEERFGLSDQMRRSAISVASNIAEGAGRNNPGEFNQFLGIANGSISELMTQIILVKELNLIQDYNNQEIIDKIKQIQNMIYKLKQSLFIKKII